MGDLVKLTEQPLKLPLKERVTFTESLLLTVPESEGVLVESKVMEVGEYRFHELESVQVDAIPAEEVLAKASNTIRCEN